MKPKALFLAAVGALLVAGAAAAEVPLEWEDRGALSIDFTYEPEKPQPELPVLFWASFKGTPLPGSVVTWYFPDSKPAVGNPVSHVFKTSGFKPVEVQVAQPHGDTLSESKVVVVEDVRPPEPIGAVGVGFEMNTKTAMANEPISFIAVFKGTPTEDAVVLWDFSSGESVSGNPVVHTFPYSRKWLVTVTVEQGGLRSITYSAYVVVFAQRMERNWR